MLNTRAGGEARRPASPGGERSLLSNIALFEGLSATEMTTLEVASRYRRFSAQETIIERDSISTDVYFLVRGSARVVNYSLSGKEITFDDLHEGQFFGELSALDGRPRSATVIAIEDSLIVSLKAQVFLDLVLETPRLAQRLLVRLASMVRAADDRIMDLSTLAAINRVQAELLRQARAEGDDRNAAVIEPIPTHSDFASRVSTTRETVARVLNDLARQGIVERRRDALMIHDLQKLKQMVEEVRG